MRLPRNPSAAAHERLNMGEKVDGIRVCPMCAPAKGKRRRKKSALGPAGQMTLEGIARAFGGQEAVEYVREKK